MRGGEIFDGQYCDCDTLRPPPSQHTRDFDFIWGEMWPFLNIGTDTNQYVKHNVYQVNRGTRKSNKNLWDLRKHLPTYINVDPIHGDT